MAKRTPPAATHSGLLSPCAPASGRPACRSGAVRCRTGQPAAGSAVGGRSRGNAGACRSMPATTAGAKAGRPQRCAKHRRRCFPRNRCRRRSPSPPARRRSSVSASTRNSTSRAGRSGRRRSVAAAPVGQAPAEVENLSCALARSISAEHRAAMACAPGLELAALLAAAPPCNGDSGSKSAMPEHRQYTGSSAAGMPGH